MLVLVSLNCPVDLEWSVVKSERYGKGRYDKDVDNIHPDFS